MISHSSIIENIVVPDMDTEEHFVERLIDLAKKYSGSKLLLMA